MSRTDQRTSAAPRGQGTHPAASRRRARPLTAAQEALVIGIGAGVAVMVQLATVLFLADIAAL